MADNLPAEQQSEHRILVFSCGEQIGDGLIKLPLLAMIRARFPQSRITWLAGTGPTVFASVLRPLTETLIDEVLDNPGIGASPLELITGRPLPGRHFDIVIDTQKQLMRTAIVKRISHDLFISPAGGFILSDRKPEDVKAAWTGSLVTRLARLLDLSAGGNGLNVPHLPKLSLVSAEYRQLAAELLPDGQSYIAIAPGAGGTEKRWPLSRFIDVAKAQDARVPVFLIGPDETDMIPEIKAAAPNCLIPEWERSDDQPHLKGPVLAIALAERAEVGLANDAGPGHMIAASGTPLVSLFGKHDPEKYAPMASTLEIVDAKAYGGTDPALIPVDAVIAAIARLTGP